MKNSAKGNLFVLIVIIGTIVMPPIINNMVSIISNEIIVFTTAINVLLYLVPIIIYFIISDDSFFDVLKIKKISFYNVILIALISMFIQPVLMLISSISGLFFPNNISNSVLGLLSLPLWQLLIMLAVFPAIFEEIIYRGILFDSYENNSFLKSAVLSSLVFGMAHLDGQQFLYAFFMGIIFAYFVSCTESIFASIISHFVINGSQAFIAFYLFEPNDANISQPALTSLQEVFSAFKFSMVVLPVLFILFYLFNKYNKGELRIKKHLNFFYKNKIIDIPYIIVIIIFVIYIIFDN